MTTEKYQEMNSNRTSDAYTEEQLNFALRACKSGQYSEAFVVIKCVLDTNEQNSHYYMRALNILKDINVAMLNDEVREAERLVEQGKFDKADEKLRAVLKSEFRDELKDGIEKVLQKKEAMQNKQKKRAVVAERPATRTSGIISSLKNRTEKIAAARNESQNKSVVEKVEVKEEKAEPEKEAVVVDTTSPAYYKQRTLQALKEGRYEDALKEAEAALQKGENQAEYNVLILRVLLEKEDYKGCYKHLIGTGLWVKRNDEAILPEDRNYIYYAYAVCSRECRINIKNATTIILCPDGRGMYNTIEEAISKCGGKEIFLTGGKYNEQLAISNKKVKILSDSAFHATITKPVDVYNSEISFKNIEFLFEERFEPAILKVTESKCKLENLKFASKVDDNRDEDIIGLDLNDCTEYNIKNLTFSDFSIALYARGENVSVSNCIFLRNTVGILCAHKELARHMLCENCIFVRNVNAVIAGLNGSVSVRDSVFNGNNIGVKAVCYEPKIFDVEHGRPGYATIEDSEINNSSSAGVVVTETCVIEVVNSCIKGGNVGVGASDTGICRITDSSLIHNRCASETLGQGKVEKQNVKVADNNVLGMALEGVKGAFKSIIHSK